MKAISITYNPFLVTTKLLVDNLEPAANSPLKFDNLRLQEWAENFPELLKKEYQDANLSIEFTGTQEDYDDLKEVFDRCSSVKVYNWTFNKKDSVADVENKIVDIFKDIQSGPVQELKDKKIIDAFNKATNSFFEVSVVATMSAGKSTLINSLLGKKLMPVANTAETATIVRIIASDTEDDIYSGIAFDKDGNEIKKEERLTYSIMKEWNHDDTISSIDIYGKIPCVDKIGMRLVLVDTPGPNNSRDESHRAKTYSMLENSDKSLVLFVMNATQNGVNDEHTFLDYVCNCMKSGGKQSRDRFIFAVNKLDTFDPEDDPIQELLSKTKKTLNDYDITDPNMFPCAALPCLQIRDLNIKLKSELQPFTTKLNVYPNVFLFEKYYDYNHLPASSKSRLEKAMEECRNDEYGEVLFHTGIPSIEEAIRLYVCKYARTMKVKDLVDSFNNRLIELRAVAKLKAGISANEKKSKKLSQEIDRIKSDLEAGQTAIASAKVIEELNVEETVLNELDQLVVGLSARIDKEIAGYTNNTQVSVSKAKEIVEKLQTDKEDMYGQMDSKSNAIFQNSFKSAYNAVIQVYRSKLSSIGLSTEDFQFSTLDFVRQEIADIEALMQSCTYSIDEGHDEQRTREWTTTEKTNLGQRIITFGIWRKKKVKHKEQYTVHIPNNVQYVNITDLVNKYFVDVQADLVSLKAELPNHISAVTENLKEQLREQLAVVDEKLKEKLKALQDNTISVNETNEMLKIQQSNLEWMNGIIDEVKTLVDY